MRLNAEQADTLRRERAVYPFFSVLVHAAPKRAVNALRKGGLIGPQTLTSYGMAVARALGEMPVDIDGHTDSGEHFCPACDEYVPAVLIAWDEYDGAEDARAPRCINCWSAS